jgi:hypothetical protein
MAIHHSEVLMTARKHNQPTVSNQRSHAASDQEPARTTREKWLTPRPRAEEYRQMTPLPARCG